MTPQEPKEIWEESLKYNSSDLGEFGVFIRLEYAKNICRQAITAERERISEEVKGMAFVAINEAWEFAYHANGYNQAIEEVLDIINRYKE